MIELRSIRKNVLCCLILSGCILCAQEVPDTNTSTNMDSGVVETNLLLSTTNEFHRPHRSSKAQKLHVIPDPSRQSGTNAPTGIRKSTSSTTPARFFDMVKTVFGGDKVLHLFDGRSLDNFYSWLSDSGTFTDPDHVFSVEDGMIRISGQHQGYLATKGQFGDYRLVAEFKWGEETWYKRKSTPRNSGLFINGVGLDAIDMRAIECQIIEPSTDGKNEGTGDVVLHGGAKLTVGKESKTKSWATFTRQNEKEIDKSADEWIKMEIFCEGDLVRVFVNGHLAQEGRRANPHQGKILLQSNGAEILFRRLDLYPLGKSEGPMLQGTNFNIP